MLQDVDIVLILNLGENLLVAFETISLLTNGYCVGCAHIKLSKDQLLLKELEVLLESVVFATIESFYNFIAIISSNEMFLFKFYQVNKTLAV